MISGGIGLAVDDELIGSPLDRQLSDDAGEQRVTLWVAPQDEVIRGDVFILHVLVEFDGGETAELTAPLPRGTLHLRLSPSTGFLVQGLTRGRHEEERIHEGIVNRAREAMFLDQATFRQGIHQRPAALTVGQSSLPGAIRSGARPFDILAIDMNHDLLAHIKRGLARGHIEGQGSDIISLHRDGLLLARDLRDDAGGLPVSLHSIHLHPVHTVVAEEISHEANLRRHGIAPVHGDQVQAALDLNERVWVDFVGRLRSDDMDEVDVLGQEVLGHDVCRLLLFINLAAVGNGRRVGEVGGDVGGVIPRPQGLLIGWNLGNILGLKNV